MGKTGRIEVITGPMFSGKTEELMRRLRRSEIAGLRTMSFKSKIDTRYAEKAIVSHDQRSMEAQAVESSGELIKMAGQVSVIGIDEAQFFDEDLTEAVLNLVRKNKRIVIAGLDLDYQGMPFTNMAMLMAIADEVLKLQAICNNCGEDAMFTFRKGKENSRVLIGEKELYEARCRACLKKKE